MVKGVKLISKEEAEKRMLDESIIMLNLPDILYTPITTICGREMKDIKNDERKVFFEITKGD